MFLGKIRASRRSEFLSVHFFENKCAGHIAAKNKENQPLHNHAEIRKFGFEKRKRASSNGADGRLPRIDIFAQRTVLSLWVSAERNNLGYLGLCCANGECRLSCNINFATAFGVCSVLIRLVSLFLSSLSLSPCIVRLLHLIRS